MVVREATPADLPAVRGLISTAGLPLDGLRDAALVLIAEEGGVAVGTVALERHGSATDTAFLLRSAAVVADRRGAGVGRALTVEALAHVDRAGGPVALLTETAEQYFPRFGFVPVSRDRLPAALAGSAELRGACSDSAQALLRAPRPSGRNR
jgi:amino-acid N-acetyltransferase